MHCSICGVSSNKNKAHFCPKKDTLFEKWELILGITEEFLVHKINVKILNKGLAIKSSNLLKYKIYMTM